MGKTIIKINKSKRRVGHYDFRSRAKSLYDSRPRKQRTRQNVLRLSIKDNI